MGFLHRVSQDLKAGWARVRYGTAQVANRALEETELLRLRVELRRFDERLAELHREIGERAVTLHERGEPIERLLLDAQLLRLVDEVAEIKAQRTKLVAEMDDVRSGE